MAGSNNFLQWNPAAANQETDAAYTSDTTRSGGAGSGSIFPSVVANKLFYQISTMVAAFAAAMAAKNYTMLDSNITNLQTALSNILTQADMAIVMGASGYIKLPGFIIQWAVGTNDTAPLGHSDGDFVAQTINWPLVFPHTCEFVIASTKLVTANVTSDLWYQVQSWNTTNCSVIRCRSHNDAGREGDYNSATYPLCLAIGF